VTDLMCLPFFVRRFTGTFYAAFLHQRYFPQRI